MKITINQGSSFQISDEKGDIESGSEYGLYYQDLRFLNSFCLSLNNERTKLLASRKVDHYSAIYYLTNPALKDIPKDTLSIVRSKFVGDGMHEDIEIINHYHKNVRLKVKLKADADFADIFEIKSLNLKKEGVTKIEKENNRLIFKYTLADFTRQTVISIQSKADHHIKGKEIIFDIILEPKERWHTCINILVGEEGYMGSLAYGCNSFRLSSLPIKQDMNKWFSSAPVLESDYDNLNHAYKQSLMDLASLRVRSKNLSEDIFIPAAGIPWFYTLFGRDSIITAYQTLIINPEIAKGALKILAEFQGKRIDKFREEQPGKILHEIRFGKLAHLGKIPHTPYYGTIDATILYIILATEYFKITNNKTFIDDIMPNIKAALEWIDRYGDIDNDGYVEYQKWSKRGLENQGWKDTPNAIIFQNGELARPPIAMSEVQGYVYRAKKQLKDIFKIFGNHKLANRLAKEANDLKARFNKDFWIEENQFFAQALDGEKKKVDSITSNVGQLLWTGIVDKDRASLIVKKLMGEEMDSGWGIRTLSTSNDGFNPVSYHNGSVWPFDNSLIAEGLKEYGFDKEAKKIIESMIEASSFFTGYRLPELFCGYDRKTGYFPVEFPTSSSPQAWSSGAIFLFLKTLLGLKIDEEVSINPILPNSMNQLSIKGLRVVNSKFDVHIKRKGKDLEVKTKIREGDIKLKRDGE